MSNRLTQFSQTALKGTGILVTSRPHRAHTRRQSLRFALHGLWDAWGTQPNVRLQVFFGGAVISLGAWCRLSATEWLWIAFAVGVVLFAELMNTAIEQTVDLIVGLRPDPLARRVKDVSASCVLVATVLAVVIGILTFLPHLLIVRR